MVKTRKQLLEELHDSVLYEVLQREVAIGLHDGEADDEVVGKIPSQLGGERKLIKKELVERYTKEIADRKKTIAVIERMLTEEGGEL